MNLSVLIKARFSVQFLQVKGGILAGLEPEFFQVALDLLDREVNRVKGALMAAQVPQGIQDQMVIKVSL